MKAGVITVGVTASEVPFTSADIPLNGLRILGRAAAAGNVFLGTDSSVTTATGILLPCGDPATSLPFTVPAEHFSLSTKRIYLIASSGGQVVDWSAD